MEINLVFEGLKFMVLGMSAVFLYLMIMIGYLKLQAFIVTKFFLKKEISCAGKDWGNLQNDTALIAVITSAIEAFRKNHK